MLAASASVLIGMLVVGTSAAAPRHLGQDPTEIAYIGKYLGNPALYTAMTDRTNRTLVARGVSDHTTFSWSPDGTQLAFTRGGGSSNKEVWLVNADGSGLKRLTFSAGKGNRSSYNYSENPSWSPDGETIAFDGERKSSVLVRPQVFTIRTDGTGEHQVTHAATPAFLPAWSPAGKILFEQWVGKYSGSAFLHSGQIDLFLADANGRNRARVARVRNELNHCACAAWSSDGTKITYEASGVANKPDIWTMNADGSGRVQLTGSVSRDENPDFSPDGSQIAFFSERTGNGQIWIMHADDGTEQQRVTREPWYDQAVRWRPVD